MRLCVALDLPTCRQNLALVEAICEYNVILKVGLRAFIRDGKEFLSELKRISSNFELFLDLKLYDIPNTMREAAAEIAELGVDMFTVHASSGKEALNSLKEELSKYKNPPKTLVVTALTSFSKESFFEVYGADLEQKALEFAKDAKECGCEGVICSVLESRKIKDLCGDEFLCVTPGIRPFGAAICDQKRVSDIASAREAKSDIIVVGRPIYEASSPSEVVKNILDMLHN